MSKYSKFKGQVQADRAVGESTLERTRWNSNKNVPLQPHRITRFLSLSDPRGSGAGLVWQRWYPQVPRAGTARALVPLPSWSKTNLGTATGVASTWPGVQPELEPSISQGRLKLDTGEDSCTGRAVSPHPWKRPKPSSRGTPWGDSKAGLGDLQESFPASIIG